MRINSLTILPDAKSNVIVTTAAITFVGNVLHLWVYLHYIKCCRFLLPLWFITFADIITLASITCCLAEIRSSIIIQHS